MRQRLVILMKPESPIPITGICNEAKMLNVAMQLHSSSIVLLQHDGFTSSDSSINCTELSENILETTGLNMEITKAVSKSHRMHCAPTATAKAA